jgi:Flp pilus assembly protein TadG
MPLLVLLILGIVDGGWAFFQNLEVRHGAREASRLAAVDYGTEAAIITETCNRMNNPGSIVSVSVSSTGTDIGDKVTVTVTRTHDSLTGILPFFDNLTLSTSLETRLEQPLPPSSPYPGAGGSCP